MGTIPHPLTTGLRPHHSPHGRDEMTIQRERQIRHAIGLTVTVFAGFAIGASGGAALFILLGA